METGLFKLSRRADCKFECAPFRHKTRYDYGCEDMVMNEQEKSLNFDNSKKAMFFLRYNG